MPIRIISTNSIRAILAYWLKCTCSCQSRVKGFPDFVSLHTQLRRLLRHIYPYFLTYRILERYADLRRSLRRPYGPGLISDMDTLIAATALERNLTVVTIDTDFQRVPNLRVILLSRATMQVLSRP